MSEPGAIRRLPRPGTIVPFGGDTIPSGWLLCNGAEVSRTEYARLFAAVDTRWGAGDGSTTFNLPDGRGKVLQGADSTNSLGVDIAASLPAISGFAGTRRAVIYSGTEDISFWVGSNEALSVVEESGNTANRFSWEYVSSGESRDRLYFNASYSSSIYSGETVQQSAIAAQYMIRC